MKNHELTKLLLNQNPNAEIKIGVRIDGRFTMQCGITHILQKKKGHTNTPTVLFLVQSDRSAPVKLEDYDNIPLEVSDDHENIR